MANSNPNLRVLDLSSASKELDLASELFHRINRIIPEDQKILYIPPNCRVREAVKLMRKHGYSQVPVVEEGEGGEVLGVFSFRSFAQGAANATLGDWTKQKLAPGDLCVDEYLERYEFARIADEMSQFFRAMESDNGILVGTPNNLIAILTPMDFLNYLYQVASPFVMVSEIELALRALIRIALDNKKFVVAARRCLASCYGSPEKVPNSLDDMTFENYRSLVSHGDYWEEFKPVFGGTRHRLSAKLKEIVEIRNDIFHFKREITLQDHEILASHRNWMLYKIKRAKAYGRKEAQP